MRKNDTLVVWKLSRLARALREVVQTIQDMQVRNIELWVLTKNIDTNTPEGRLFFHMTAAFDEFQHELIVENTRGNSPRPTGRAVGAADLAQWMTKNPSRGVAAPGYRKLPLRLRCPQAAQGREKSILSLFSARTHPNAQATAHLRREPS